MKNTALLWFRTDLRIHDNEALSLAISQSDDILPVYVFDVRDFEESTSFGFKKTGVHRARFLLESVIDLKKQLQKIGSDLIVRVGRPEDEIAQLANEIKASWVFCNRDMTPKEIIVQDGVESNLWKSGREVFYSRGKMLYYTADLPFPVMHTPDTFTTFRKEVEQFVPVRCPLDTPNHLTSRWLGTINLGEIPSLEDLGYSKEEASVKGDPRLKGGEEAGLAQLHYYLWDSHLIKTYKETRNDSLGWDYSTKFSAWLAVGALSPKKIYHEIKKYEAQDGANESTYWVIFELLWRDFFRLMGKKYGDKMFHEEGMLGSATTYKTDNTALKAWITGNTGVPFIDANMRQLNATGFMSNRGRQNVASFLTKDLGISWLSGAEYFESMLIDYDPCSNYGNWNYIAGIGNDPRENRYFNILGQAKRYDANGKFTKYWVPELSNLNVQNVHCPDQLSQSELASANIMLGTTYPQAIVSSSKWV